MNVFGIEPRATQSKTVMAIDALFGLTPAAKLDIIRVALDEYDAETLDAFANEIGRIAHEKHRNTMTAQADGVASAGACTSLLDPAGATNQEDGQ